MYGIELAYLAGKKYTRARGDLLKKVSGIASVANILEIQAQADLINKILHTDYVETADINEFEVIREKLRGLMKYLPDSVRVIYDTDLTDEVLSMEWNEAELENDELKNYKERAKNASQQTGSIPSHSLRKKQRKYTRLSVCRRERQQEVPAMTFSHRQNLL